MTCVHSHTTRFFSKCKECGEVRFPSEKEPVPNYFELFDLQPTYFFDIEEIKQKFYKLSRLLHPDKYQTQNQKTLEAATHWSAVLNSAFSTLKDNDERAQYLFELAHFKLNKTKDSLPPDLAEDYFNLQEALEENKNTKSGVQNLIRDFSMLLENQGRLQDEFRDSAFREWENAQRPLDENAVPFFNKAAFAIRQKSYVKSMTKDLEKKWQI